MSTYEVAVFHPAARGSTTFSYSNPANLPVEAGQLVSVPFGQRVLPGLVIGESDSDPDFELKPIQSLLDAGPVMSSEQIRLARWISEHYCCSLSEALKLFLPAGVRTRTSKWLVKAAEPPHSRAELSYALAALPDGRPFSRTTALTALARLTAGQPQPLLKQLISRGLVKEVWAEARRSGPATLRYIGQSDQGKLPERATQLTRALGWLQAHKPASEPLTIPLTMAAKSAGVSVGAFRRLAGLGYVEVVSDAPLTSEEKPDLVGERPPVLTPAQRAIYQALGARLGQDTPKPALLHGVTASGKTEIYLRLAEDALRLGQSAIILVPEIALTPQTIGRFERRFPGRTAALHSQLTAGERYRLWRRVASGDATIVIGARSATFAPARRLGLIVVDEEHEYSYKQDNTPRYHARDAALKLGELTGALVVMGSATPALETYSQALAGRFDLFELSERIAVRRPPSPSHAPIIRRHTDMPAVEIVDLRAELRAGNRSIFSRRLARLIEHTLSLDEQTILFLNRRGTSTFVICRDCGLVMTCRRCDVSLVYHRDRSDLLCHLCGRSERTPETCPQCHSTRIRYFGAGTERVEAEVRKRFPDARVVRWDRDTAGRPGAHAEMLRAFQERRADIMVGTQMIAKGLDLPAVTLVGIVSADVTLHLPDFRAAERTFQLLTQVAGRAGRGEAAGRVVLQTYSPSHYAIQLASRHDYTTFYKMEMPFRQERRYPPTVPLARLMFAGAGEERAEQQAQRVAAMLRERLARLAIGDLELLGPAPAYHRRVRGKYRWQILVRGPHPQRLLADLPLPPGWAIDVEPVTTL